MELQPRSDLFIKKNNLTTQISTPRPEAESISREHSLTDIALREIEPIVLYAILITCHQLRAHSRECLGMGAVLCQVDLL